jgi:SAM-dependent methyltransferase
MKCQICSCGEIANVGTFQDWISVTRFSDAGWREVLEAMGGDSWLRQLTFMQCDGCGFVWVSPTPSAADLAGFYHQYRGTTSYSAKKDKKIRRSLRRIRKLARQVPGRRFLDVGCNVGFSVEAARLAGFVATGIDVDPHAVSLARAQFPEASFHSGTVEAMVETGETFDLVHCSEVIEHLPEVRPFASALAALTRPGGALFLTTPDAKHFRRPRNFMEWDAVKPPEHLCWFTRRSLRMLFEDLGFGPIRFLVNVKPGIKMLARKPLSSMS